MSRHHPKVHFMDNYVPVYAGIFRKEKPIKRESHWKPLQRHSPAKALQSGGPS